ncbi:MAG: hypothetical protein WDW36_009849 [Sanguina aurantia]
MYCSQNDQGSGQAGRKLCRAWMVPTLSTTLQRSDPFNPIDLLQTLIGLPAAQQQVVLVIAGLTLQQRTGMDCNIFAGPLACKRLPAGSSYEQQCPGTDPMVDCIFYNQIQENIYDSPVDNLEEYLKSKDDINAKALCPECFDKVQALWCALASPKCGSFKSLTQNALLPSLASITASYNSGKSQLEALGGGSMASSFANALSPTHPRQASFNRRRAACVVGAVSLVFDSMALVLPCREMCESALDTCGCGRRNDTFGELITWAASQALSAPGDRTHGDLSLPASFTRLLFAKVWDRGFCSLFVPQATDGFTGVCTAQPRKCSNQAGWCEALDSRHSSMFQYIQGALALQMAKAVTGWITDDETGLWQAHDAVTAKGDSQELDALTGRGGQDGPERDPSSQPRRPGMGAGQVAGIVFLTLVMSALLAGAGFMTYRYIQSRRETFQYFELNTSDNFKPLVMPLP